jgi:divinyl protochlorophyllide a 8-vinyl-reductase
MGHSEKRLTDNPDTLARIGPNAIVRVGEALGALFDPRTRALVFEDAGLGHYLTQPPREMVDEREVASLHQALRGRLGIDWARRVGHDAGLRTGDYLLANRIPPFAQRILKLLPGALAEPVLLKAIARNAWTFAGSARFAVRRGHPTCLILTGSRVCAGVSADEPLCDFYAATFERLL